MKFVRTAIALSAALVLLVLMRGTASAQAPVPSNDTFGGAKVISVPFSEALDTTAATTDGDDTQLNASCGAPATDASVWYAFTAPADAQVIADVAQSDYSAGVLVGVGVQGALQTVACGQGTVGFYATGGTTYYLLAIDDQLDQSGNGGTLNISVSEYSFPSVNITVDAFGQVNTRTGNAAISGTYTCKNGDFIDTFVQARQNVGRFAIFGSGSFFEYGTCDGTSRRWSALVIAQNGKFAGGKTLTTTFTYSCGPFTCAYGYVEQKVQLRGGKISAAGIDGEILFLPAIGN